MPNVNDIALSSEDIQVLSDVQCNFYGENPTTHQETILQYLEEQNLVERLTVNSRTHYRLTPEGSKMLHKATAKLEEEESKRRHNWRVAAFTVVGAGAFTIIAALLNIAFR